MKTPICILLAAASMVPFASQAQQTKKLTADKTNEYGLVYSLPTTALSVVVTATRTVEKAGPFFQYAKKYLGTENVVKTDSEKWKIESVDVMPYGVADPEQQYLMQLKAGATTSIYVADDGMLLSINTEPDAQSILPAEVDGSKTPLYTGKEYLQYVTDDFLASQSSAKRAQMLAESLMEVRDAKISLTRGTAETMPTDGKQLELMLQSLADQEATMTRAFIGSVSQQTYTRVFTYIPGEEDKTLLFRMSDFAGFVDKDDLRGAPVYLSVKVTRPGGLPKGPNGEEKKLPKDAVVYGIPGTALITITLDGSTLYSRELDFAQYGTTFGLSPSLFSDKKAPSFATFNPVTGAIMEIGKME